MAKGEVVAVRRDNGSKTPLAVADLAIAVPQLLETMQKEMLDRARKEYDDHRKVVTKWDEVIPTLNGKNVLLIPHCLDGKCADDVKDETAGAAEDGKAPSMGAKGKLIHFIL